MNSSSRDHEPSTCSALDEALKLLVRLSSAAHAVSVGIDVHNRMSPDAPARRNNLEGPVLSELWSAHCDARNWLWSWADALSSAKPSDGESSRDEHLTTTESVRRSPEQVAQLAHQLQAGKVA